MFWSKGIIGAIRLIFIVSGVYLGFRMQFLLIGLMLGSLLLTFIPEIFTKVTGVRMTSTARLTYTVFIFGTQWLGTYLRLYDTLLWWDIMLHFVSGILLGYVGILLFICLDKAYWSSRRMPSKLLMVFSFLVAVSGAVFWEIMEFLSDTFLGSNTQLGSLQDTMEDMIFGTLGALIFIAYLWIKAYKKRPSVVEHLIELNLKYKKDE